MNMQQVSDLIHKATGATNVCVGNGSDVDWVLAFNSPKSESRLAAEVNAAGLTVVQVVAFNGHDRFMLVNGPGE